MGWYFDNKDLNSKKDFIEQLNEIEAYRELDGDPFDFGSGLIPNGMSLGSEDAYYEIDMQTLEDIINFWEFDRDYKLELKRKEKEIKNRKKEFSPVKSRNRYYLKEKEKKRLNYYKKVSWHLVEEKDTYLKRIYSPRRCKYFKKISNKSVRRYIKGLGTKGNSYRKVFDYWWTIY